MMYLNPADGPQDAPETLIPETFPGRRLKVLSYNIQTGIATTRYRDYVTYGWRHLVPHTRRWQNLDLMVESGLRAFDIVGLQEMDGGSMRTGYVNQARYLAERADFPFWYNQVNRRMGRLARHSNGLLSRIEPTETFDYKLPGLPGRGALLSRFGRHPDWITVIVVHLALSQRARTRQMLFLSQLVNAHPHAMVMGDFNCDSNAPEVRMLLDSTDLVLPDAEEHTFPTWCPRRRIDHILVTRDIVVEKAYVPQWAYSDHLPVALELRVPPGVLP